MKRLLLLLLVISLLSPSLIAQDGTTFEILNITLSSPTGCTSSFCRDLKKYVDTSLGGYSAVKKQIAQSEWSGYNKSKQSAELIGIKRVVHGTIREEINGDVIIQINISHVNAANANMLSNTVSTPAQRFTSGSPLTESKKKKYVQNIRADLGMVHAVGSAREYIRIKEIAPTNAADKTRPELAELQLAVNALVDTLNNDLIDRFCFVKDCQEELVKGQIWGTINSFPDDSRIPVKAFLRRGTTKTENVTYDYPDGIEFIGQMKKAVKNKYQ